MGTPTVKEYGADAGILKFFPYHGAACVVPQSMVTEADDNGYLIAKAGLPFPSNDANCLGYLLHDVDVTNGDAPGTYVYEGCIDPDKIDSSITIADAAKIATPNVTFYGEPYTTA